MRASSVAGCPERLLARSRLWRSFAEALRRTPQQAATKPSRSFAGEFRVLCADSQVAEKCSFRNSYWRDLGSDRDESESGARARRLDRYPQRRFWMQTATLDKVRFSVFTGTFDVGCEVSDNHGVLSNSSLSSRSRPAGSKT